MPLLGLERRKDALGPLLGLERGADALGIACRRLIKSSKRSGLGLVNDDLAAGFLVGFGLGHVDVDHPAALLSDDRSRGAFNAFFVGFGPGHVDDDLAAGFLGDC